MWSGNMLNTCRYMLIHVVWERQNRRVGLWVQTAEPLSVVFVIWTSGERPRNLHLSQVPG